MNPLQLLGQALFRTPENVALRADGETRVIHRVQQLHEELSAQPWNWHSERLLMGSPGLRRAAALQLLRRGHVADGVVSGSALAGAFVGDLLDQAVRSPLATGEAIAVGLLLATSLGWGLRRSQLHRMMHDVSLGDLKTAYEMNVAALGLTGLPASDEQPSLVALMQGARDSFGGYEPKADSVTSLMAEALQKPLQPVNPARAHQELELPETITLDAALPKIATKLRIIQAHAREQVYEANLLLQRWDLVRSKLPQN